MMFTNIDEALNWLMKRRNETKSFDNFKAIMQEINNPQDDFKIVHVAGTNGKGSTTTFLRDLFMAHGYNVGTLQSPHFLTHLDRIRYNGENIEGELFLKLLNDNYAFILKHNLNMFETDFVIMCQYFKLKKIDIAIVEVGLGGRLDSTNVINHPLLSIITTIGYDHMDRLGDTLAKICIEKCGIIKKGCPVLVGGLDDDLKEIVLSDATSKGSKFYALDDYQITDTSRFIYHNHSYQIKSLALYQIHNAALAIEAYQILSQLYGYKYDESLVYAAIKNSIWHGRFEVLSLNPRVIIDGAHNIDGIKALANSIEKLSGSKAVLFAALKTKEYQKMIEVLKGVCDRLILTTFNHYQACQKDDYPSGEFNPEFYQAYQDLIKEYDNVVIAGSLYFITEFVQEYYK